MSEEVIVYPTAVITSRKKLTDPERDFISKAQRAESFASLVPDEIEAGDFRVGTSAACKAIAQNQVQYRMLFPLLGRLMLVARTRPELWQSEHETYEDYCIAIAEKYGVSRSTIYEARQAVDRWGKTLSIEDFKKVGRSNLKKISKAVVKGEEGKGTARKLLEIAGSSTGKELDEYIESKLHISPTENIGAYVRIPCNKKQESIINKWFADAQVQAEVGSEKPAEILTAMIEYCSEWKAKAGDAERAGREPAAVAG